MKKQEFIANISNWDNHRHLLWPALEATKHLGLPVLELGCGEGSTPFMRQYCKENNLELFSYDYNETYSKKYNVPHITNWELIPWRKEYGVVLIDHSPGEHRKEALKKLLHVKIIVIHDSEPVGWNASDYQVREQFGKFKYVKDFTSPKPGAWATALSNTIDVTKFEI